MSSSSSSDEPEVIESAFALIVFWATASTTTAFAYSWGVGFLYFQVLGGLLWTSTVILLYHYREEIVEPIRERWEKSGEPVDPDDVIEDVLDDGDGGGSA